MFPAFVIAQREKKMGQTGIRYVWPFIKGDSVAIGTTTPSAKLHVSGTVRIDGTGTGNTTDPILVKGSDSVIRQISSTVFDRPWSLTAQMFQSTSGSTPANLAVSSGSMTLPNNCVGIMKVELVANGGSGLATHKIQGVRYYTFNKNGSTLTIDAADVIVADKEGGSVTAASWQVISASNQPVIEVTGVAAVDFNWFATVTISYVVKS
jgi:hypothetical protein